MRMHKCALFDVSKSIQPVVLFSLPWGSCCDPNQPSLLIMEPFILYHLYLYFVDLLQLYYKCSNILHTRKGKKIFFKYKWFKQVRWSDSTWLYIYTQEFVIYKYQGELMWGVSELKYPHKFTFLWFT